MIHFDPESITSVEWAIYYYVLACTTPHIPAQIAQEKYMWNRLFIAAIDGEI